MDSLPTQAEFLAHDLEVCSIPDEEPDCPICKEPFTAEIDPAAYPLPDDNSIFPLSPDPFTSESGFLNDTTESESEPPTTGNTEEDTIKYSENAADRTPLWIRCCNNVFCRSCIYRWISEKNTCPLCRKVLFKQPEPPWSDNEESDEESGDETEADEQSIGYNSVDFDSMMDYLSEDEYYDPRQPYNFSD